MNGNIQVFYTMFIISTPIMVNFLNVHNQSEYPNRIMYNLIWMFNQTEAKDGSRLIRPWELPPLVSIIECLSFWAQENSLLKQKC